MEISDKAFLLSFGKLKTSCFFINEKNEQACLESEDLKTKLRINERKCRQ